MCSDNMVLVLFFRSRRNFRKILGKRVKYRGKLNIKIFFLKKFFLLWLGSLGLGFDYDRRFNSREKYRRGEK